MLTKCYLVSHRFSIEDFTGYHFYIIEVRLSVFSVCEDFWSKPMSSNEV